MPERTIALTDPEAALMARGGLRALVRPRWNDLHKCPFGAPGDTLLLKETWRWTKDRTGIESYPPIEYKADYAGVRNTGKWRSPVTMPRSAVRHRLTVHTSRAMLAKDVVMSELDLLSIEKEETYFTLVNGDYMETTKVEYLLNRFKVFRQAYHITGPNQWLWYCEMEATHA